MLDIIIINVYGIKLGFDVGTYLVSIDRSFDGCNSVNIEGLFLAYTLVSSDNKVLGTILRSLEGITLGLDVGT